jgi:hypothetical protein
MIQWRLLDLLEDDVMQQFLYNEYELETSVSTISRILKSVK